MCDLLEFMGSRSGIDCDLRSVTDGPTADRLVSMARYLAATDRAEFYGIEEWQLTHPVPCKSTITPDDCAKLLREVGADESLVEGFFVARIAREEDPCRLVAFDTTRAFPDTRTPEPCDEPYVDHADTRTRGLLVLFSMTSRRPLAYTRRPDHIPETLSWERALGRLVALGARDVTLVPDHISEAEFAAILQAGDHVLAEASVDWEWVREQVETHVRDLHESASVLDCDALTRCISVPVTLDLDRLGEGRARADEDRFPASAGASRTERQVCLHLYFDPALKDEQDQAFLHELEDVASLVQAGIPLDDRAGKVRDGHLDVRGRGRKAMPTWRKDAVSKACHLNGIFALVSDSLKGRQPGTRGPPRAGAHRGSHRLRR